MGAQEFHAVREDGSKARHRMPSPPLTPTLALCFLRVLSRSVQAAGGRFKHVPTGNTRLHAAPAGKGDLGDGPKALSAMGALWAIPTVECPEATYRQGAADYCAVYGLASVVHAYGDASDAAAVAASSRATLTSRDAFGHVRDVVNDSAAG